MTDREMLEMAAKAAGVPGGWREKTAEDGYPAYSCGIGNVGRLLPLWNPLTDDGDALRLAVKLDIDLMFHTDPDHQTVQAIAPSPKDRNEGWTFTEGFGSDKAGATRRAIVMAAATLGKEMQ